MTRPTTRPADTYSPLYFLASLGAGGLTVTFFMYLMFWVPHAGRPVPVFADIAGAFTGGALPMQAAIVIAVLGIAAFAVLNIRSLVWNLSALARFKRTEGYRSLRNSNGETQLLAAPLAAAMTVNALFIVGLVFVPGLWGIVEYLFPAALAAFLAIGLWAFRLIGDFLGRVLTGGGVFDVTANNSFAQLLPAFALSMVGVGLAAPAAMSAQPVVVGVSVVLSTFFGIAAALYAVIAAILGFNSMLHHGTARESGPTLMVVVPIMTVLGILFMRQDHGLHVTFDSHAAAADTMVFMARLLAVQALFLALGMVVLLRQRYFDDFVLGSQDLARLLRAGLPRRGAVGDAAILRQQGAGRRRRDRQVRRCLLGHHRAGAAGAGADDRAGDPAEPAALRPRRGRRRRPGRVIAARPG